MKLAPPWPYRVAMATAVPLIRAAGLASPSFAAMVRDRDRSSIRFRDWAPRRDPGQPLILVHAPSAGEWRQAEPVVECLRSFRPGLQFALTYTSPSAVAVADGLGPEVHGFLPWDRPADVGTMLDLLRPAMLVVTKLDLWPELALQARARAIPIVLIAATVRERSTRLHGPGRLIVRSAYESVHLALAVGPEDAVRLAALGVEPARISVVGDPRYDSARERIAGLPDQPVANLLVAGSTWPADDRVLLAAFARVRKERPDARLLIVPHRPGPGDQARLTRLAAKLGLPPVSETVLDEPGREALANGPPIMLASRMGQLAHWYGLGTVAYVGGGFGRGLHSVIEPAAWGRPVLVGPGWRESAEAVALENLQALTPVERKRPVEELAHHWTWLLQNSRERARAGATARALVEERAGAAKIIAGFVLEALRNEPARS